jgi:ELWxxDGT repeat protein
LIALLIISTPAAGREEPESETATYNQVADIYDGGSSLPEDFTVYNGKLYFSANEGSDITEGQRGRELWVYDGVNSPTMAADIAYGINSSSPEHFAVFNGKLYFSASGGGHSWELWEFNGTTASEVANINPSGGSYPRYLTVFNNKLYFNADDGTHGEELWVYDGTNPPSIVFDYNPGSGGSYPLELIVFNNKLYYNGLDPTLGQELMVYDGTNPPSVVYDFDTVGSGYPGSFEIFNNKLYFKADNGTSGDELWVYDGTNNPQMIYDITGDGDVWWLTTFNGKLYYTAQDASHGDELWAYDGTNPPSMVADIWSGANDSRPVHLIVNKGRLYFEASDSSGDRELWMYNGINPPSQVTEINPSGSSYPRFPAVFNDKLYFQATSGPDGYEPWVYITPPNDPSNLIATPLSQTQVSLSWTDNSLDETKFRVYKAHAGQGDWTLITETGTNVTTTTATGLVCGTAYDFDVRADNTAGHSGYAIDSANTDPCTRTIFYSQAVYDGFVKENGENTNKGGLINTTNLTCNIGDDGLNRQFRTILHFNTSRIPDDAVITKATLQVKEHSWIGDPPYLTLGNLWADIRQGWFSNNPGLVKSDFAAAPSMGFAAWLKLTPSPMAYPIFRANIKSAAFQYINLTGTTQFRVRYAVDDDNDFDADYIKIFCGNMPVPFNRPVLRVWYYVP